MAAFVTACASVPGSGPRGGEDPIGGIITRESAPQTAKHLGPSPSQFLGRNVSALEAALGRPALVRREGANEFRRYDRRDCRVFAVVTPAGGTVSSLSTGPVTQGDAAPSFEACTAGL
jgi:hypothetical protein